MNRLLHTVLATVAACGAVCVDPAVLSAQPPEEVTLETIQRRLEEWRNSFVNLRVVWELRHLSTATKAPLSEWSLTDDLNESQPDRLMEWIWADHGLDLFVQRSIGRGGAPGARTVEAFNGPRQVVFRSHFARPTGEAEPLKQLEIFGLGVGKPISALTRQPVRGLYWAGGADWLPDLLSKWSWSLERVEEIGGQRCVRIVAKNPDPNVENLPWDYILWLDSNHDFLVRRFLSPGIPDRRVGIDSIVDDFERLDAGIWFPKRGRIQLQRPNGDYENQLWYVTEVAVNQNLDLKRFEPPSPEAGTVVIDKGKVYRHGAPPVEGQIADGASDPASRSRPLPARSGTPPTQRWIMWSGFAGLLAVMSLLLGLWLSRKADR